MLVQGLEHGVQAVQGCRDVGSWLGYNTHQENCDGGATGAAARDQLVQGGGIARTAMLGPG